MFKRISIFLIVLLTVLCFVGGVSATDPGLFVVKDADNTYIDYVDANGTSIMKIDDTDGVTIANYTISTSYSSMSITSTTDASSLTTGSFTTAGGASVAKQLFIGDDLDMSVSGTGTYDFTLKDSVADALSIVGGTTDMIVFCTDTDTITITPPTTITGLLTSGGGITVGTSGAGFDVTFYGDNAGSDFVWDQNGDTYGSLTLGANTDGVDFTVYGTTTGNYLRWDRSTDDLLLVGTATQLGVAGTTASTDSTTGSIHTAGGLGVGGACFIAGAVEIGVDGTGTDFTLFGDTADYAVKWDASGDTNGALYVGADTYGVMFELYGDVASCGVFWNPSTDTNGTLTIGTTGGSAGVDVVMYGDTDAKYWKWDQSADGVVLVGTFTETGNMAVTGTVGIVGAITISPAAAGTFINFALETEWVSGTLIDADFGSGSTLSDDTVGMELDFNSNVTMTTDKDVTGYVLKLPALTQGVANTTLITGWNLSTAGAIVQSAGAGTITWKGLNIQLPNSTQTAGTVNSYAIYITAGTVTSGSQYGIYFPAGTLTTAIALAGTCTDGIAFSGTVSDEAIQIGGTYDHGIRFTEDMVAGDVTNSFINIGDYTTGIAVAPDGANMFGVMHNVTVSVNVAYWYQAYYTKITTSSTTTNTSIAGHALRMNVATNIAASYGIQCHTNITAGADVTEEVISVSAMVDLGTGETTSDRVVALQAGFSGSGTAGTVDGDAIVAYFWSGGTVVTTDAVVKAHNKGSSTTVDILNVHNATGCTTTNMVHIDNDDTATVGVLFEGTHTLGIDMNGTYTVAGISMDGATFAAGDNEIEMRNNVTGDKTIIASGAATDDAGIIAAVGADADIADGSLYMSCTDGAGVLFIKKNDVWTAFSNP